MKRLFLPRSLGGGTPPVPSSAIVPFGSASLALETARSHLASCESYQAFLNLSGSEAAEARTYLAALPSPADGVEYTYAEWITSLRPFGMISTALSGGFSQTRSALYGVRENGRLNIALETTVPTVYQPDPNVAAVDLTVELELADRWIQNQIGQIANEFMAKSGQPGFLDVSSMMLTMGPCRERHEEPLANGNYYWTLFEIVWGATD
jgi:hypothetical protein